MDKENKVIFDTIKYEDDNAIDVLINTMDKNKAIYILNSAIEKCKNSFSIEESAILYKALKTIDTDEQ